MPHHSKMLYSSSTVSYCTTVSYEVTGAMLEPHVNLMRMLEPFATAVPDTIKVTAIGATAGTCLSGLMDEAEVQEVVHLVERQKKRLHFAGSMLHVQPAQQELRQLTLFQGLSDKDFAKVGTPTPDTGTLDFAKVETLEF